MTYFYSLKKQFQLFALIFLSSVTSYSIALFLGYREPLLLTHSVMSQLIGGALGIIVFGTWYRFKYPIEEETTVVFHHFKKNQWIYLEYLQQKLQVLGAMIFTVGLYYSVLLFLGFREPFELTSYIMLSFLFYVLFVVFFGAFINVKYPRKRGAFIGMNGVFLWSPFLTSMSALIFVYTIAMWYSPKQFYFEIMLAAIAWTFFDSVFSLTKETKKAILKEN